MSQLQVSHGVAGTMNWKVTNFHSPMTGTIQSAQTRTKEVHYPIKASQQMLQLRVVVSSLSELQQIQDFVRQAQVSAVTSDSSQLVTLWWPERNIDNWTGLVMGIRGGGERFLIATTLDIQVMLVDSLVSRRTLSASTGNPFTSLINSVINPGYPDTSGIKPPARQPGVNSNQQPGVNLPISTGSQPGVNPGGQQPGITTGGN